MTFRDRTLLALVLVGSILILTRPAAAQTTHDVLGTVVDSTGAGVGGAMVVVLALPDSVLTKFSLTDGDGNFTLRRVPGGEYILQVTVVGHQTVREPIDVVAEDLDAGTIRLQVLAVEMEELVVSVDHVPFVSRRDTLDYNARAFEVRPNATVEELLARLPGIEVDSDGTISAQGEQVENVLVDGKEFFGTDPTIATRNLPANAVERVQVYDKESDMAEFTGIADGEEERTINLELREDARRGTFGHVVGGVGGGLEPSAVVESQPDGRTRYNEAVNFNRFSPSTQLALLGGANNVNEAGFRWGDVASFSSGGGGGSGRGDLGGGRNDGFTESLAFGLNASHDFADDRWIRTSYFFNTLDNTQKETTKQQQLLGASVAALKDASEDQVTEKTTHRLDMNAQFAVSEGHDIRLRGNLNVGSSGMTSLTRSETTTLEGSLQNEASSSNTVDESDLGGSARLTWRKRLSETGRAVVLEARASMQEPETVGKLVTTTQTVGRDGALVTEEVFQEQTLTRRTLSLSERLSMTQPLGQISQLELFGQHRSVDEDRDNSVFDIGTGVPVVNDELSSGFERSYSYLEGGFRLNRNTERARLTLAVEVQGSTLEGTIRDRNELIENGYTHVLPSANLRWQLNDSKTFSFRYRTATREPSMTQLQPFADNTSPTAIYVGNPDLTPEYAHSWNADYRFFDQFSFVNLFTYVRFSYTDNAIVNSRVYDSRALQTIRPVNVDHRWSANGGLSYGRPIRPIGARINLDYSVSHNRGVELLNERENRSRVWQNSVDASVDNRDKDIFDVRAGARFSLNSVAYSLNEELNQSYMDRTFYGNGLLRFGTGWTLQASLNWRLYDEDVFGAGDRNVAMLNASLAKLAMSDRVELALVGFDLLDQNKGLTYTNGASFIQERRAETLGRYLMVRVMYRLGSLGAGAAHRGGRGQMR
jgi:outer membrane receptor protein involved in Fe transport